MTGSENVTVSSDHLESAHGQVSATVTEEVVERVLALQVDEGVDPLELLLTARHFVRSVEGNETPLSFRIRFGNGDLH